MMAEEAAADPAVKPSEHKRSGFDVPFRGFDLENAHALDQREPRSRVRRRTPLWARTVVVAGISLAISCIIVGVLVISGSVTLNGEGGTKKSMRNQPEIQLNSDKTVSSSTTGRVASISPVSTQAEASICSSSCSSCYAAEGADHCCGIRDQDCSKCADGYPWWPCGPDTISKCLCGSRPVDPPPVEESPSPVLPPEEETPPISPPPAPMPTPSPPGEDEDEEKGDGEQPPPTGSTCTSACDTCVAAPDAASCCGIRDEHCALCATGYPWWPCGPDTISKCLCNAIGPKPEPEPEPEPEPPSSPSPSPFPSPSPPGEGDDGSLVCNQTDLQGLISRNDWEKIFPHRNNQACKQNKFPDGSLIPGGFFEYEAFIKAAGTYKCFLGQGTNDTKKRELAAFLAQISHETTGGWPTAPGGPQSWGLCWKEEVGCEQGQCTQYCAAGDPCTLNGEPVPCPCASGKTYHGRGPMQLSWNYNYAPAGVALREPLNRPSLDLLANPEKITEDPVLAFATAIYFWMSPRDKKPACHDVMTDQWTPSEEDRRAGRLPGFGVTTNVINGGLECNIPNDYRVEDRVQYYLRYTKYMNISPGDNLYCDKQRSFY